jgi:site-specific DNA recombinase
MATVDIYTRTSTQGDRNEHDQHSHATQEAAARRHAEHLGLTVGAVFNDTRSGKATKLRTGLVQAIERVQSGASSGIVAEFQDRFARNNEAWRWLLDAMKETKGSLYAPDLPDNMRTPSGALQIGLKNLISEYQLDTGSERAHDARIEAVMKGIALSVAPPGYVKDADRRLVPSEHAPAVQEAFRRRLRGDGPTAIAEYLNAQGVTTGRGSPMSYLSVTDLLRCRTYLGELNVVSHKHGDDRPPVVNPTAHTPLVSRDLFDAVQAVTKGGKKGGYRRGDFYLLAGCIFCAGCAGALWGTRDSKHVRYYRCQGRKVGGCTERARVNADAIEAHVTRTFLDSDGGRLFAKRVNGSGPDVTALEEALEAAELRLEQAKSPETQDALGADWAAFIKDRREARDAASAALGQARASVEPGVTGEARRLIDLWAEGGPIENADRRRLIAQAFPRITVERIGPRERVVSVHPAEDDVIL